MNLAKQLFPVAIALGLLGASSALEGCSTTQPAKRQLSDSAITAKVKARLAADPDVAAHNINVNTEEGIVYLLGRVKTQFERAEAERVARNTDGVRDVVNHLEVGDITK